MKLEVHENFRSEIRGDKNLLDLWSGHKLYIIGIVSSWATFFMLQVFDFMQRIASYRLKHRNARLRRAGGQGRPVWAWRAWALFFLLSTPPCFLSAPPLIIFIFLHIFLHILYFWLAFIFLNIKNHKNNFLNFLQFYFIFIIFFTYKIILF